MGGGGGGGGGSHTHSSSLPLTEDVFSSTHDFRHDTSDSSGDEARSSLKLEGVRVSDSCEFTHVGCNISVAERQRSRVYTEVLRSYEDFHSRINSLEEAKNKILSYIPGSWDDNADSRECDAPNAISLLLIGPKSSGKSSLVNKISRVFEDNDVFLPARAQVSCSSSPGDGTYFLHEYTVPRNSGSVCLYDTRGLSVDSSENVKMIKRWMTKGVCHGELIRRKSDSVSLKAQLKRKARKSSFSGQVKQVDFVIFVVNGLSVLESMDSAGETEKGYSEMIATNFNNPLLSFKDDKPAIVVTHGDLLSLCDRVKVRTYLGELLGVPPTTQIFDIPESNDLATTSAILDMLIYCLDRADRNLPTKDLFVDKVQAVANLLFWIVAAVVIVVAMGIPSLHRSHLLKAPIPHHSRPQAPPSPPVNTPAFHHSKPKEPATPPIKTPVLHCSEPRAPATPPLKKARAPATPPSKKPRAKAAASSKKPKAPAARPLKIPTPIPDLEWHKIRHLWFEE